MTDTTQPGRKKIGRPPKSPDGRPRVSQSMRLRGVTRERLIEATKISGRSISEEAEHRVEQSFEQPKLIDEVIDFTLRSLFGPTHTRDLAQRISIAVNRIERVTGKPWNEDYVTKWEAKQAAQEVISTILNADEAPAEQDYDLPGKGRLTRLGRSMGRMVAEQVDLPTVSATGRDSQDRSIRLDENELRTLIEGAVRNAMEQARRDLERDELSRGGAAPP